MRTLYIVTYDIKDEKRLRKVHRCALGFGEPLQYSVFRCELSAKERVQFMAKLRPVIKQDEDQVLFFPLGPVRGNKEQRVIHLGLPYRPAPDTTVIV